MLQQQCTLAMGRWRRELRPSAAAWIATVERHIVNRTNHEIDSNRTSLLYLQLVYVWAYKNRDLRLINVAVHSLSSQLHLYTPVQGERDPRAIETLYVYSPQARDTSTSGSSDSRANGLSS